MKLLRNSTIYMIANIASSGVPFFLLPILTHVLTAEEYGKIIAFALLVTLCQAFTGLSVHAALGVLWFKQPEEEMPYYVATALVIAFFSTLVVALLVTFLLWFYPHLLVGVSPTWGLIAALTAGSNILLQSRLVLWQSQAKALYSATLQFLASVLNIVISLVAVLFFKLGSEGRNGGIALAAFIMAGLSLVFFLQREKIIWSISRARLKIYLNYGLPLVIHAAASVLLGSADRWIVSMKVDIKALGVYGAAAQLGMIMNFLADAFVKGYSPWVYGKLKTTTIKDKQCVVGSIYLTLPIFLLISLLMWITVKLFVPFLLGPTYKQVDEIIIWFMLGGGFAGAYMSPAALFFFYNKTHILALVSITSGILGTLLSWKLAANFGLVGAAIGYMSTWCILAMFSLATVFLVIDLPWKEGIKSMQILFEFQKRKKCIIKRCKSV